MGLLIAVISPSIVNLQKSNKKKKFELYGKTMIEATKLYVEKEGVDITELADFIKRRELKCHEK